MLLSFGCASWWLDPPKVATKCSPDHVWSAALASLQEFEIRRIDENARVIETDWIADVSSRRSGAFQRDINEERARFVLTITASEGKSIISVQQVREFWSPQGVQSRSWRQIPPNKNQEQQLAARIQGRLKRAQC